MREQLKYCVSWLIVAGLFTVIGMTISLIVRMIGGAQ